MAVNVHERKLSYMMWEIIIIIPYTDTEALECYSKVSSLYDCSIILTCLISDVTG
jgi:hypothetical protein